MKSKSSSEKNALISVMSNLSLVILKFVVGILTGSVSVISEAVHSCMDLLAAVIAFFSVKYANKSPDDDHNYGYGKIENVSGVIEALLIFAAVFYIIYESVLKILHPGEIESIGIGFAVMAFSGIVNFFVSQRLFRVAKENHSVALEADALHLRTDTYSSLGVSLGLLLIWFTGREILDPIVAILVALFICYEAYFMLKKAFEPLLDKSLPKNETDTIKTLILNRTNVDSFHKFWTRTVGKDIFIEFDLVFDSDDLSIRCAHDIGGQIKQDICNIYSNAKIRIHLEPLSVKKEE